MTKDHSHWRRRAAPDHMLITSADIRRNDFQNDDVLARPAIGSNQFWEIDTLDLDISGPQICYSAIACHGLFSLLLGFDVFPARKESLVVLSMASHWT
jgi:hypothetical protein